MYNVRGAFKTIIKPSICIHELHLWKTRGQDGLNCSCAIFAVHSCTTLKNGWKDSKVSSRDNPQCSHYRKRAESVRAAQLYYLLHSPFSLIHHNPTHQALKVDRHHALSSGHHEVCCRSSRYGKYYTTDSSWIADKHSHWNIHADMSQTHRDCTS